MPRRKHKIYSKPRRAFDIVRIKEENVLINKYGLKSKREIWKADSAVEKIRRQAKLLLTKSSAEQEKFINKLKKQGFSVKTIADILALNKENYLKRRLQSIVVAKKIASTPKQARQFIAHKHIAIEGKKVNVPSYLVSTDEEDRIELTLAKKEKPKKEESIEKIMGTTQPGEENVAE